MTALVQRKLRGTPIPSDQLIAQWEDLRRRNSLKGPVASFPFDVHFSEPEKTYQWRIQLECGCVRDAVTRHHTDDKPADKVERLGELAETRKFRMTESVAGILAYGVADVPVLGLGLPTIYKVTIGGGNS